MRASVSEVSSALGNVETGGRQPLPEALREATDLLLIRVACVTALPLPTKTELELE